MTEAEISARLSELENKVKSLERLCRVDLAIKRNELIYFQKQLLLQKMEDNDLYVKIKNLEATVMLYVGIPLIMTVFAIVLIVMKIS